MSIRSRMSSAVLMLTLSMGALAACGGSDDGGDKSDPTSAPTSAGAESATEDAPDASSGSDGKPSKDEVVDGYAKLVATTMGDSLPKDIVNKVVTCFVDEVYDDASPKTLNAIADSKAEQIDPDDSQLFTDASGACTKKITGQ